MAVLNGGTIAEKKSSEPELAAEEKMGEVQIAIEYNNPRKAVNFLSGKSSDDLESEEKAQLLKALRRQLDGLVLEQGKELRGEAQNNPVNKLPENEEKRNKGIITFATYEEAKEYADKMPTKSVISAVGTMLAVCGHSHHRRDKRDGRKAHLEWKRHGQQAGAECVLGDGEYGGFEGRGATTGGLKAEVWRTNRDTRKHNRTL